MQATGGWVEPHWRHLNGAKVPFLSISSAFRFRHRPYNKSAWTQSKSQVELTDRGRLANSSAGVVAGAGDGVVVSNMVYSEE